MRRGLLPRLNLELLAFHILLEFPGGTPEDLLLVRIFHGEKSSFKGFLKSIMAQIIVKFVCVMMPPFLLNNKDVLDLITLPCEIKALFCRKLIFRNTS